MKRICVFCGSSPGRNPAYRDAAEALGRLLAREGIGLVYGGSSVGLMTAVADAALAGGGEVIGVIPHSLEVKEIAHPGLSAIHVVGSMHERKALMVELADGFVALPGGMGTFDEFFEVVTWAQLGIHVKPCGLLNVGGYYDRLTAFLDHAVAERFVKGEHREMIVVEEKPEELLERFRAYRSPVVERWLDLGGV
ncbi:TIGR00730 family Rossman fold protein [Geobacter sp.]|uniref:LOG family protein n=1 Tax=Geobacter sp. TaxID=46610 RepID=UPI0027B90BCC|nr:TIGR00730 family Rossman fold protein [Geobacter sp.]